MGWVCTTTLTAHTTAIAANARNKITSMLFFSRKQRHHQAGDEQVQHGNGEEKLPRKTHQLVVAEARKRPANPDEGKQQESGLSRKPEQRHGHGLDRRRQQRRRQQKKNGSHQRQ